MFVLLGGHQQGEEKTDREPQSSFARPPDLGGETGVLDRRDADEDDVLLRVDASLPCVDHNVVHFQVLRIRQSSMATVKDVLGRSGRGIIAPRAMRELQLILLLHKLMLTSGSPAASKPRCRCMNDRHFGISSAVLRYPCDRQASRSTEWKSQSARKRTGALIARRYPNKASAVLPWRSCGSFRQYCAVVTSYLRDGVLGEEVVHSVPDRSIGHHCLSGPDRRKTHIADAASQRIRSTTGRGHSQLRIC